MRPLSFKPVYSAFAAPSRLAAGGALLVAMAFASACGSHAVTRDVGAALLGEQAPSLEANDSAASTPVRPAATFPVRLAVARLSGEERQGRWIVRPASSPDLSEEFRAIQGLPEVTSVAFLSRLLLDDCRGMRDVRAAALEVQADILLAWTVDSQIAIDDHDIGPLNLAVLGFAPNQEAIATVTASAAFIDTRTGFVYGIAEGSASKSKLGTVHNSDDAAGDALREGTREAIRRLQPEVEMAWKTIVTRFAN